MRFIIISVPLCLKFSFPFYIKATYMVWKSKVFTKNFLFFFVQHFRSDAVLVQALWGPEVACTRKDSPGPFHALPARQTQVSSGPFHALPEGQT